MHRNAISKQKKIFEGKSSIHKQIIHDIIIIFQDSLTVNKETIAVEKGDEKIPLITSPGKVGLLQE